MILKNKKTGFVITIPCVPNNKGENNIKCDFCENERSEMGKNRILCRYPLCINYDYRATDYCCNGCSWDHQDYIEIHAEDKHGSKRLSTNRKQNI